jgi:hypothetical protein
MSGQFYFNRIYSLTIGTPAKVLSTGFSDTIFESDKAKTISGLRLTFDISKTETSESNSCTLTINNLTDSTRKFIKARTKDGAGMIVALRAGYEEMGNVADIPVLFVGDITNVSHDTTRPEVVTTLECHDGYIAIKTARFAKSYAAGTKVSYIMKDIVAELNLPMQATFENVGLPDYRLSRGFVFDGFASDALTRLCSGYKLRWSVQNNALKIYQAANARGTPGTDNRLPGKSVIIGSPKRISKNMKGLDIIDFSGYEFKALLMPGAEPGGKVSISLQDEPKTVVLAISEVHHKGDTHGKGADAWTTTIKARDL